MARQVIQEIRLNTISPHLFFLHITWQTGIALCPDVALIWRGKGARVGNGWSPNEDAMMASIYPNQSQIDIMRALPLRAWQSIRHHAAQLELRRPRTGAINTYHETVSYADLAAAEHITENPQHKERLRSVVDDLARRTVRGGLTAHWWLPLDAVSYASNADDNPRERRWTSRCLFNMQRVVEAIEVVEQANHRR